VRAAPGGDCQNIPFWLKERRSGTADHHGDCEGTPVHHHDLSIFIRTGLPKFIGDALSLGYAFRKVRT
jgi:hypothetical protein